MDEYKQLGARIRKAREAKGTSLRTMATDLKITPTHLSHIERGIKRCSDELLANISKYLNITEKELFEIIDRIPKDLLDTLRNSKRVKEMVSQVKFLEEGDMDHLMEVIYKLQKKG